MKVHFIALIVLLLLAACSQGEPGGNPDDAGASPTTEQEVFAPATVEPSLTTPTQDLPATQPPEVNPSSPTDTAIEPTAAPTETQAPSPPPAAASLPDPGGYTWQPVIQGLAAPIGIANAGDGSERLFIIEKAGQIKVFQAGQMLAEPFLDIRGRVGSEGSEQGLLGLVFHPNYAENGFFYVNYTDANGDTVIARYSASAEDPNRADPESELRLINQPQPYPNHNGGGLAFGPDGYLYIGLGDGGAAGDPQNRAQDLTTLLGKMLRIDVDSGDPYGIPPDNPFSDGSQGAPEILYYGLRNPWRFSFDSPTGDLYIADVGQNAWEEIDFVPAGSPAGLNFGWDYYEGNHPYEGQPPAEASLIAPVAEYSHQFGCSVTGGLVYRGPSLPEWQGVYLFADYCTGLVWGMIPGEGDSWTTEILFENVGRVASFGQDEQGEAYLVDINGTVYQLAAQ